MAEQIIINFEANTTKAVKSVDALDSSVKKTGTTTTATTGAMGALNAATGGLMVRFAALKTGIIAFGAGLKTMRVLLISTGIGALVLGVIALQQAFTSSEEGQNKWNKLTSAMSTIVAVFTDRLAALGRGLINLFTEPIKSIKNFGSSLKEFVMDKVEKVIEGLGYLGEAISLLFEGEFKAAMRSANKGISSLNSGLNVLQMAVDATYKSFSDLSNEIIREFEISLKISKQRAKADVIERKNIVDRAKANRDRADLLEKAVDKEKFALGERIAFLKEAGELEDKITDQEIKAARLRLNAKILENKQGDSTKADKEEEANLTATLLNLETAKLTKQKEVTSQIIALRNEEKAAIKANADELKAFTDVSRDEREKERTELEEQANLLREKFKNDKDALLEIENSYLEQTTALQDRYDEEDAVKQREKDDAKKIADQKEIDDAKAVANAKIEIAKKEEEAKKTALNGYASALSSISGIISQETQAGKSLAIASSLVNTYAAISGQLKAFSGVPVPGFAIAQAIATGVVGLANVKKIASVKIPGSKGGSSATGSVPTSGAQAQQPSFNIVGQGQGSQIASALAQQQQAPVQAFVVSQDVTTAQSLQNNIIQGATLGG